MSVEEHGWFAILRKEDAVDRHIAFARLFNEELAVWRDDRGVVNAWENRCPHRGVRLTVGTNTGTELKCRYHGWRFEAETGKCTFIPAHPKQTPPRAAKVQLYRCAERYGLIWIGRGDVSPEPHIDNLNGTRFVTLRSLTVHAPFSEVRKALDEEKQSRIFFVLQQQSENLTTIHGVIDASAVTGDRIVFLRDEHARLKGLRQRLEMSHRVLGCDS